MHHRARDLTGQKFGFLEAIAYAGSDGKKSLWRVRCVCGTEKVVVGAELTKKRGPGHKSCGCLSAAMIGEKNRTHGMTTHPAYAVWRSMLGRCCNQNHEAFKNYGERGIQVCKEWLLSFDQFWEDMGPSYQSGLTIERRDNSAGYSAENCLWATSKEQNRNRRTNRYIDTPQGQMLLIEAAELSGLGVTTLIYRMENGCPINRLFDPPDYGRRFSTL